MEDTTVVAIRLTQLNLSLYVFDLLPSNICHAVQAMFKSNWVIPLVKVALVCVLKQPGYFISAHSGPIKCQNNC